MMACILLEWRGRRWRFDCSCGCLHLVVRSSVHILEFSEPVHGLPLCQRSTATRQKTSDRRRRGRRQRRRGDTGARAAAASESLRDVSVCPHEPRRPGHALQQMPHGSGHGRFSADAVQGFRLVLSIGSLSWVARTRCLPSLATLVHKCFPRPLSCGSSFRDFSRSHNSVKPHR